MRHDWVGNYIGIPFKLGGRDRRGFDCWGLVRDIYKEHHRLEVEDHTPKIGFEFSSETARLGWTEIPKPKDGCAALLGVNGHYWHIGYVIQTNDGKFHLVHTMDKTVSLATRLEKLNYAVPFTSIKFYEPKHNNDQNQEGS